MNDKLYEDMDIYEIVKQNNEYQFVGSRKKVISEISLKIYINGIEQVSLLCMNQNQEELAIGFLYNEGVIDSFDDIVDMYYNEKMQAVIIKLKEELSVDRQESLRSVTTGCGKCFTYINPLKQSLYRCVEIIKRYEIDSILSTMQKFIDQSEIFIKIGGVHSALLYNKNMSYLYEDIGRHNCLDKIAGAMLKDGEIQNTNESTIFISGRISSEIITKTIRLGVPIIVSRTTPTTAAVRLAKQYNITLLGYVRGEKGIVYTCPERLI